MRIIVLSQKMNGTLDDDYTLYENGDVLHFYDANTYPGGQNISVTSRAIDLPLKIKNRLLADCSDENKELAKQLLGL